MVEKSGTTAGFFAHGRILALSAALALSACGGETNPAEGAQTAGGESSDVPRATQIVVPADLPDCLNFTPKPKSVGPTEPGGDVEAETAADLADLGYTLCGAVSKANDAVRMQEEADRARDTIFADGSTPAAIEQARATITTIQGDVENLIAEAKSYSDLAEEIVRKRDSDDEEGARANLFLTGDIRPEKVADTAYRYVRIKAGEEAAFQERYDAASTPPETDGLTMNDFITFGILGLLALAVVGVAVAFLRGRKKPAAEKEDTFATSSGGRNRSAQPVPQPELSDDVISKTQHEAEVNALHRQIDALNGTIAALTSQNAALKEQAAPAMRRTPPPADTGAPAPSGGFGETTAPPASPAPSSMGGHAGVSFAQSPEVLRLIEEVNTAGKVALNRGGPTDTRVETYANDRTNALEVLFASDTDRFWLMPNPNQPGEAALIPGLNTKSKWGNFKTAAPDHPLAHHFELVPGDRFAIHKAATVRKDSSGQWVLVTKGEVSGVS